MNAPAHWCVQYIGKPWAWGGRGPDTFDCWGLLYWVYRHHYGIELPLYTEVSARDMRRVMVLLDRAPERTDWQNIKTPIDGCAVGMSSNTLFHHVGVYISIDGGLILHASDGKNVLLQPLQRLQVDGYRRIEFFKHKQWPT